MKHNDSQNKYSIMRYIAAWMVHLFTASTAIIGIFTLYAIYNQNYTLAIWWMGAAIIIDAVDGTFARKVGVKEVVPQIDGALLDNIADYLNYVITPCFFLLVNTNMLPDYWRIIIVSLIALASAYQFTQKDAKTPDHFFKGFPSYWNIVVFYLFIFNLTPTTNTIILLCLSILVFVPIKYVYPSRMDYLTEVPWLRKATLLGCVVYFAANAGLLWSYPDKPILYTLLSFVYVLFYLGFSLFRTYVPLLKKRKANR